MCLLSDIEDFLQIARLAATQKKRSQNLLELFTLTMNNFRGIEI